MAPSRTGVEKYISKDMKLRILSGDVPKWMRGHIRATYIIKATLSAPLWMHRRDLKELRQQANAAEQQTGIRHVLDHIVPIDHKFVCGLTVPWNLRVIPYACNASKRNDWHPDQTSFKFHPQLTLF